MTTASKRRKYQGPAIFSKAYRPFFLGATLWAIISLILWILMLSGTVSLPSAFSANEWHKHELLFGYTGAVIAGFLLTAIPNWTGRLPISGLKLFILVSVWLLARIIILFSANINPILVMLIDLAFPFLLSLSISIEIIAGKNWRNLRVLIVLFAFMLANFYFHIEIIDKGYSQYSANLALAIIIILIMLIGGRIIPSFTRNWLVKSKQTNLPTPFNQFDIITMIVSIIALLAFMFLSNQMLVAVFMLFAGLLNLIRLSRWSGIYCIKQPMIFILHIAYLFIPLGFFALAISKIAPSLINEAGALHLFSAGAIGIMTIAMMCRVSLAHGGQKPEADKIISLIFIAIITSVILRFAADFFPSISFIIHISASLWIVAFALFIIRYWRILTT
ncbi:MAG: NnrS family protein [Devosiaceae bacterium]|nr:NnrS family protein [Devosiaceae bacterium]